MVEVKNTVKHEWCPSCSSRMVTVYHPKGECEKYRNTTLADHLPDETRRAMDEVLRRLI